MGVGVLMMNRRTDELEADPVESVDMCDILMRDGRL
jgi:hypothetical protein